MAKRTTYRDGQKREAHRDKTTRREIRKAARKLNRQERAANVRAKYGPAGRSAPVTVRHLDEFGQWVEVGTVHQRDVGALSRREAA